MPNKMNPLHEDRLRVIASDETLVQALRALFSSINEESKPIVSGEDDVVIGQKYRAYDTGRNMIERAFLKLNEFGKPSAGGTSVSRAR